MLPIHVKTEVFVNQPQPATGVPVGLVGPGGTALIVSRTA